MSKNDYQTIYEHDHKWKIVDSKLYFLNDRNVLK